MMDQKTLRQERKSYVVFLVLLIYFVISLLTNILGPIIPEIIRSFSLSLTAAALLPFAFFIAYGLTSIPAGILIETYSEKTIMLSSFVMSFLRSARLRHPDAVFRWPLFRFLLSGLVMAMLQVALQPACCALAGGEEHFAFNSTLVQLVFGSASFLSPHLYTYLVNNLGRPDVNKYIVGSN